jgi:alkane 1-monooxygenase
MELTAVRRESECALGSFSYVLLPVAFLALIPVGLAFGLPWLAIVGVGIVLPVADELIGRREAPYTGPTSAEIRWLLLALLVVVTYSLFRVARFESWVAVVLAGASSGYVLGTIGIPGAHELGHRRAWFDRLLGETILACIGYGHYRVAHSLHHFRACLPDDPATAWREESLWGFFPRYFRGIWQDANEAAARMRGYNRHRPALLLGLSALIVCLVGVGFGLKGLVFWMVQGIVGLFLIASVDYIQHWGLKRKPLADGRYEPTNPSHTWESPFWLSERMTFNMTRHNFHHLAPSKKSCHLERVPTAPQMPFSYGTMVVVAAIPPIFRRLMEPRLPLIE